MKKNYIADCLAVSLARILGRAFSFIPPRVYVGLGRAWGRLMFYLDRKHRDTCYRNIRFVFCREKAPRQLNRITREAFENLGQNLFEILALPRVNKDYLRRYIRIEGLDVSRRALSRGQGLIYVTLHLGNWELANIACGLIHDNCSVIVKPQKHSRLNTLLNRYRAGSGVKVIPEGSLREIVRSLRDNGVISVVCDHGAGKGDRRVDFFGRPAPMPQGAAHLALKFGAPLALVRIIRISGPFHKIIIEPFGELPRDNGDDCPAGRPGARDIEAVLGRINRCLEGYIRRNPGQYLWAYKRWRHSRNLRLLILSDGRAGHIHQSQAVAGIIAECGWDTQVETIKVEFRNRLSRLFPFLGLRRILKERCYDELIHNFADVVIAAGSSLASVNLALARENRARAIQVMRPARHRERRFDLLIIPRHDNPRQKKNIVITEGALNSVRPSPQDMARANIGLLLGGEAKGYSLEPDEVALIASQITAAAGDLGREIFATTSRRTSKQAEASLKQGLCRHPLCRLLVIANEENIPDAVSQILRSCGLIVVTADSISMISQAASSGRYVLVAGADRIKNPRHLFFLRNLEQKGYIYCAGYDIIAQRIKDLLSRRPGIKVLQDRELVKKRLALMLR